MVLIQRQNHSSGADPDVLEIGRARTGQPLRKFGENRQLPIIACKRLRLSAATDTMRSNRRRDCGLCCTVRFRVVSAFSARARGRPQHSCFCQTIGHPSYSPAFTALTPNAKCRPEATITGGCLAGCSDLVTRDARNSIAMHRSRCAHATNDVFAPGQFSNVLPVCGDPGRDSIRSEKAIRAVGRCTDLPPAGCTPANRFAEIVTQAARGRSRAEHSAASTTSRRMVQPETTGSLNRFFSVTLIWLDKRDHCRCEAPPAAAIPTEPRYDAYGAPSESRP